MPASRPSPQRLTLFFVSSAFLRRTAGIDVGAPTPPAVALEAGPPLDAAVPPGDILAPARTEAVFGAGGRVFSHHGERPRSLVRREDAAGQAYTVVPAGRGWVDDGDEDQMEEDVVNGDGQNLFERSGDREDISGVSGDGDADADYMKDAERVDGEYMDNLANDESKSASAWSMPTTFPQCTSSIDQAMGTYTITPATHSACTASDSQKVTRVNWIFNPALTTANLYDVEMYLKWQSVDGLVCANCTGKGLFHRFTFELQTNAVAADSSNPVFKGHFGPKIYGGMKSAEDSFAGVHVFEVHDTLAPAPCGSAACAGCRAVAGRRFVIPARMEAGDLYNCTRVCHPGVNCTCGTHSMVQCRASMAMVSGQEFVYRLRKSNGSSTAVMDGVNYVGAEYEVSVTVLKTNTKLTVGRVVLASQAAASGITKLSSAHDHIGCVPCDLFYEKTIATGPFVSDGVHIVDSAVATVSPSTAVNTCNRHRTVSMKGLSSATNRHQGGLELNFESGPGVTPSITPGSDWILFQNCSNITSSFLERGPPGRRAQEAHGEAHRRAAASTGEDQHRRLARALTAAAAELRAARRRGAATSTSLVQRAFDARAREARAALALGTQEGAAPRDRRRPGSDFDAVQVSLPLAAPILRHDVEADFEDVVGMDAMLEQGAGRSCVAYGLGVLRGAAFAEHMSRMGCETHAFDCTINPGSHLVAHANYTFHPWCIAPKVSLIVHGRETETVSLSEAMRRLNHSHVDLLKLDVHGFEEAVLQDEVLPMASPPGQILFELRSVGVDEASLPDTESSEAYRNVNRLFLALHDKGYRVVSKQFNVNSHDPKSMEFVIVNVNS